jgi:hypothetical protein
VCEGECREDVSDISADVVAEFRVRNWSSEVSLRRPGSEGDRGRRGGLTGVEVDTGRLPTMVKGCGECVYVP